MIRNPYLDSIIVGLTFIEPTYHLVATGFSLNQRYRMNSAYDPDPALGGGALSGFNQWAAMYLRYRVLAFEYKISFINNCAQPFVITYCPSKNDFGAGYANPLDFAELPYGGSRVASAKGGMDRASIQGSVDLVKYSGYTGYLYDDVTSSLVTSNPATLFYWNFGINCHQANIIDTVARIELKFITQFFELQTPVSV